MSLSKYDVLIKPLITEKSNVEREDRNKVTFKVHPKANKIEIKKYIEELLSVKVAKVATMNFNGKVKRLGRNEGKRPDWKKAVVTLKDGESSEFLDA